MSEETPPELEVETQEATPEELESDQPQMYVPDNTPIAEGPLKGLPAWVRDLKTLFLGYGQQIVQLSTIKQEMEMAFGEITQAIILYLPEEVGKEESPVDCTIRLIKEFAVLRDQLEPMGLRLAAAEAELAELKKAGG
jgi:hypothetical protein